MTLKNIFMDDIRMIVTDMDGTFLNSEHEVSPEFPEVYEELKKKYLICSGQWKTDARHYQIFWGSGKRNGIYCRKRRLCNLQKSGTLCR